MSDDKNAFLAFYVGYQNNTSQGGVMFKFLVPYDEVDHAHKCLGGVWRPDQPVNVGIVQMKVGSEPA